MIDPMTDGSGLRVLFVCTANISRSPYAEMYARHASARRGDGLRFDSAGTWAVADNPMDAVMARQLAQRGVDPNSFRSRRVTAQEVVDADLVLTMEESHRTFLLDDTPAAIGKIFTLGQFGGRTVTQPGVHGQQLIEALGTRRTRGRQDDDVADPYRRGEAVAEATADRLSHLIDVTLAALVPVAGETPPPPLPSRGD